MRWWRELLNDRHAISFAGAPAMKAFTYYRVSTSGQARSDLALDAQRAAVAQYCDGPHCDIVGELRGGERHAQYTPCAGQGVAPGRGDKGDAGGGQARPAT